MTHKKHWDFERNGYYLNLSSHNYFLRTTFCTCMGGSQLAGVIDTRKIYDLVKLTVLPPVLKI